MTDMSQLFSNFREKHSKWDMPNLTVVDNVFHGASSFNQVVSKWDVSNVTNMSYIFYEASSFNQDVSEWDVSAVINMSYMINGASSFFQDLSGWGVRSLMCNWHMFEKMCSLMSQLMRFKSVSSFFEGPFLHMPIEQRRMALAPIFYWKRRHSFMLFRLWIFTQRSC